VANPVLRYFGPYDGFLPDWTGYLVAYCIEPSKFAINKYVRMVPTKKMTGLYALMGRDAFVDDHDVDDVWRAGSNAPDATFNQIGFTLETFQTHKRATPWVLPYETIDQTEFADPKTINIRKATNQRMVRRTNRLVGVMENTANYNTNHFNTMNTVNGGFGGVKTASDDPNDPHFEALWKTLIQAFRQINLDTNGDVEEKDLHCVVGPDWAIAASSAPEIVNYVRETPYAHEVIAKGLDPQQARWGMPATYRGFDFVVEPTVHVTGRPNAANLSAAAPLHPAESSSSRNFIKVSSIMNIICKQGALKSKMGGQAWESIQLFHYKELIRTQGFDEPKHDRVYGRVTENTAEVMASSISAYLVSACL
jgi:hypothetical protein